MVLFALACLETGKQKPRQKLWRFLEVRSSIYHHPMSSFVLDATFNVTLGRSERKTVALLFDASSLRLRETPERWTFRKDGAVLPEKRYFVQRSHGPRSVFLLLKSIVFRDEGFYLARILNSKEEQIAQVTVKLNIIGCPKFWMRNLS